MGPYQKIYYNSILSNSPMVKILPNNEKSLSDIKVKERINALLNEFYAKPQNKSVRVVIDVDPN